MPWIAGFLAYQLTLPTYFTGPGQSWTVWWTARQADLGIEPGNGWSASLVSLAVATALTALIVLRGRRRWRGSGVVA
jgi:NCS1 family nucleobase:cation symporter-1